MAPFRNRVARHNALSWLFKLHLEINQARSNIAYNLRRDIGIDEISIDDIRVKIRNDVRYEYLFPTMNLFDNLRDAEVALFETGTAYRHDTNTDDCVTTLTLTIKD